MAEHLHHLVLAVDIGIRAVARVGYFLHHRIVQVTRTETADRHIDAIVGIIFNNLEQFFSRSDSYVPVAVRAHDDAVVTTLYIVLLRLLVRHAQRARAGGRAGCLQTTDLADDGLCLRAGR